jgi:hypothetical protein
VHPQELVTVNSNFLLGSIGILYASAQNITEVFDGTDKLTEPREQF